MALSDMECREALIKGLETVIQDIRNRISPLSARGYEVFGRDGVFGDRMTGQERYWLVAGIITDKESDIGRIKAFLTPPASGRLGL